VAELDKLAPEPGEDDELDTERRLIQAASRIRDEVARAAQALSAGGAEGPLSDALSWLGHAAPSAEGLLDASIEAVDRVMVELNEAQRGVENALEHLSFDPGRLEAVEERLFAIRALARKHQVAPDSLPELAQEFSRRLGEIDMGGERITALEAEAEKARQRYQAKAGELSQARTGAAERLDRLVTNELGPLRMENARFHTMITPGNPGADGQDDVSFTASINPGAPSGPIDRIASGGELSRFLLAMKVCLASRCRRRHCRCRWAAAVAACRGRAGIGGHPQPAGGGARGPSLANRQDHRWDNHPDRCRGSGTGLACR
jgi:DNA repair protein RecN (Recombination protein N)